MECIRISSNELDQIGEVVTSLFPDNYALQLESSHINQLHMHSAYVLQSNGETVGTAILYENPGHIVNGQNVCTLGYFNCIDSVEASKVLMHNVKDAARSLGRSKLVGPLNGSTWESYRLRMTDKPDGFFLESATPAYYNRLFRANGFTVLSTYQSIILPSIEGFLLANTAELDAKPFEKITLRYVNPDNYEADLRAIHQLSLASFKDNFLFTPYPWESFIEKYRMLEFVASPEMTLLAEYKGQIIGYIFMIPDFLDPNSTRCVLKTYCVHPHFRSIGLSSYMTRYFLKQMKQRGFEQCIIAYVINEGVSQHMFNQSSEVFREYSLYACTL